MQLSLVSSVLSIALSAQAVLAGLPSMADLSWRNPGTPFHTTMTNLCRGMGNITNGQTANNFYVCPTINPDAQGRYRGRHLQNAIDACKKARGTSGKNYLAMTIRGGLIDRENRFPFLIDGVNDFILIIDGVISWDSCKGKTINHMLLVKNSQNLIIRGPYNANPSAPIKSGFQGRGFQCTSPIANTGISSMVKFVNVKYFMMNNLALIDSPRFHLVLDHVAQNSFGEFHNLRIWGQPVGVTDGIDIHGSNIYVHDVMVTNGDECVTVKSPAYNIMVERIYCARSGCSSLGSLGSRTNVSNVHYKNVYVDGGNAAFYIKSSVKDFPSGNVKNVLTENFLINDPGYGFFYQSSMNNNATLKGIKGIKFTNIQAVNWYGTIGRDCKMRSPRFALQIDLSRTVQSDDFRFRNFNTGTGCRSVIYGCYPSSRCAPTTSTVSLGAGVTLDAISGRTMPASITNFPIYTVGRSIPFPSNTPFAISLFPSLAASPPPGWWGY